MYRNISNTQQNIQPFLQKSKLKIVGNEYKVNGKINSYLLYDSKSQLFNWYPYSLLQANGIHVLSGDEVYFSDAMYDYWFGKKIVSEYKRVSNILIKHFGKIITNSDKIIKNKNYRNLKFTFLQSHLLNSDTATYSLGDILQEWIKGTKYLFFNKIYILKTSVSITSHNYTYVGWNVKTNKLVKGYGKDESFLRLYFSFKQLSSNNIHFKYPDLASAMNLLDELKIQY